VSYLVRKLDIPVLSSYGLQQNEIPEAVEKTMKASSYKGNPIPLTEAELTGVLERAL
jgi:alcohol dehydrogenase class IV